MGSGQRESKDAACSRIWWLVGCGELVEGETECGEYQGIVTYLYEICPSLLFIFLLFNICSYGHGLITKLNFNLFIESGMVGIICVNR